MNAPSRLAPYVLTSGNTYTLSADDFENGLSCFGNPVSMFVLDTPLCCGCDSPVPADSICHSCRVIHAEPLS